MDLRTTLARFATSITFEQRSPGYWDADGVHHVGEVTEVTTRAVILPGVDKGIVLPEGVRSADACRVWSPVAVYGAQDPAGAQATRFSWRGRRFEVQEVMDRNADDNGKFWRAVAFRVRNAEADEA